MRASREKEEQMSRLIINEIASEWSEKVKLNLRRGK